MEAEAGSWEPGADAEVWAKAAWDGGKQVQSGIHGNWVEQGYRAGKQG